MEREQIVCPAFRIRNEVEFHKMWMNHVVGDVDLRNVTNTKYAFQGFQLPGWYEDVMNISEKERMYSKEEAFIRFLHKLSYFLNDKTAIVYRATSLYPSEYHQKAYLIITGEKPSVKIFDMNGALENWISKNLTTE